MMPAMYNRSYYIQFIVHRVHEQRGHVIHMMSGTSVHVRYHRRMEIGSEQNARRILAVGVLFATVGILALVITLMQPGVRDEQERLADEIFRPSNEEKHEVLIKLQADSTGREVSDAEKLRVLESLRGQ